MDELVKLREAMKAMPKVVHTFRVDDKTLKVESGETQFYERGAIDTWVTSFVDAINTALLEKEAANEAE